MRWSQTWIPTARQAPKDAEAISHILLSRAGFVRMLSSGVYSYLPLGTRVLSKISNIIREEMMRGGADELLMPALQPAELWKKTGRYEALGNDKIHFKNRAETEYVLGPTHEEVVTDIAAAYVKSYKDLPRIFFQIQTKFRDEARPRFGIVRTKEFIMKDAYSFDRDDADLDASYARMSEAYNRIFSRCGLDFLVVHADPGLMGGKVSQEFMVRSSAGEDFILESPSGFCASREIAGRQQPVAEASEKDSVSVEMFPTPGAKSIDDLCRRFSLQAKQLVKTLIYKIDESFVAALVRGDHELHEGKLQRLVGGASIRPATLDEIKNVLGVSAGSLGPKGLAEGISIVADWDVSLLPSFVAGANQEGQHFRHVVSGRDYTANYEGDIRYAEDGDLCPESGQVMVKRQTMEVGHVFKLGTRYTDAFDVSYLDAEGKRQRVLMGCYGIGVNRILASNVEQHHDEKGMVWPLAIAPYSVHLITVNSSHQPSVDVAEKIYSELSALGIDVLYDDRDERAGVKFNDADLIGNPYQIVVGERNLNQNQVEIVERQGKVATLVAQDDVIQIMREKTQTEH